MTEPAVELNEAPEAAPRSRFGDTRSLVALILGGLVLVGWVALLAGTFAGLGESASRTMADVLVGLTLLAGVAAVLCSRVSGLVALIAAAGFAAVWYFLGWGLSDYAVNDGLYYGLIAAFYLTPPIVGISAIMASRTRR